jgi:hypothetical protein
LGSFFENDRNIPKLWATPLEGIRNAFILSKNVLGYILGDFSQTHLVTLVPSLAKGIPGVAEVEKSGNFLTKKTQKIVTRFFFK